MMPSCPDDPLLAVGIPAGPTGEAARRFMTAIWRLHRELGHELGPLLSGGAGADPRAYFLLRSILGGKVYPKLLSEALDVPPNLISRHLDGLHRQGYIEREVDTQDSRRIRLSVTPAGLDAVQGTEAIIGEHIGRRLARLPDAELTRLLDALDALSGPDSGTDAPAGTGSSPLPSAPTGRTP